VALGLAVPAVAGTTTGKVVRVSGSQASISVGAEGGVREGYGGEVFYVLEIAGQKKRISVAQFSVQSVDAKTSVIRVFNTSAPVNTGYLIQFNETLSSKPKVVAPTAKGNVYVSSEPTGATILVNGRKNEQVTPTLLEGIPVGEVRLELRKDFYFGTSMVQVVQDQLAKVNVELKADPAELRLSSVPFEAKVFIDDEFKGSTPVFLKDLNAGRHVVRMEKPSHFPTEETIFVKGGSKEELTLTLKPYGTVAVTITPREAELTLDGEATPCPGGKCELKIAAGEHEVLVTADKFQKFAAPLRVTAGETVPLSVALRGFPSIEIASEPDKVYVSLGGNSLGRTPLKLEFPEDAEYEFTFTKDQYLTKKVKVKLVAGKKEDLKVTLPAMPRVVILTTPDDAEVFLIDKKVGTTPLNLTLEEAGTYVFTLKKPQYKTVEVRAQVDAGDVATFDETLVYQKEVALQLAREAEHAQKVRLKKILGWTFSGVGVAALGASIPFYVTWSSKTKAADKEYAKYEALTAGTEADVFQESIDKAHSYASTAKTNFILALSFTALGLGSSAFGVYELLTIPKAPAAVDEPEGAPAPDGAPAPSDEAAPATSWRLAPFTDGQTSGLVFRMGW
jgi:hypothetical protein